MPRKKGILNKIFQWRWKGVVARENCGLDEIIRVMILFIRKIRALLGCNRAGGNIGVRLLIELGS